MDITKIISTNLTAWMEFNPSLNTLTKVSKKAKVGFGTVRRAKNGDANITVLNLTAIATAFDKTAIDLLTPPVAYQNLTSTLPLQAAEKTPTNLIRFEPQPDEMHPLTSEVVELMRGMDEAGKGMVTERARMVFNDRQSVIKTNKAR